MRRLVSLWLVGLAVSAASAAGQPGVPPLTGRVVDNADILSASTEAALTARLQAHEDSTSNQIAVLTIPSLNGEVLEPFATEVFRSWGLGRADVDNGVLLLIARDERKIRIEVGYGLEGALPDITAAAIIGNEMTPRFRSGDFDGGTLAAVDAIIGSIEGEYTPAENGFDEPWFVVLLLVLGMGGVPGLAIVRGMLAGPVQRYVFLILFSPLVALAVNIGVEELLGVDSGWVFLAVLVAFLVVFAVADLILSRSPWMQEKRRHYQKKQEAFRRARKAGRTSVVVDGISYSVPTSSSSGGGFSGGGGSSGGGGASGGW